MKPKKEILFFDVIRKGKCIRLIMQGLVEKKNYFFRRNKMLSYPGFHPFSDTVTDPINIITIFNKAMGIFIAKKGRDEK